MRSDANYGLIELVLTDGHSQEGTDAGLSLVEIRVDDPYGRVRLDTMQWCRVSIIDQRKKHPQRYVLVPVDEEKK